MSIINEMVYCVEWNLKKKKVGKMCAETESKH